MRYFSKAAVRISEQVVLEVAMMDLVAVEKKMAAVETVETAQCLVQQVVLAQMV